MLAIFDAISLAGASERPNEDRWGQAGGRIWVIDGATGLGDRLLPGPSDAAWVAQRASEAFARHAATQDTRELMTRVAEDLTAAFARERTRLPAERWEIPCASFMLLTRREDGFEIARLGDCRCLIESADAEVTAFGATADSEALEAELASRYPGGEGGVRYRSPEALAMLRAGRALYNQPGETAVLTPNAEFLPYVTYETVAAHGALCGLAMTDGFAALGLRYREIDDRALMTAAREAGLLPLAERLRAIERLEDPGGVRFPRWKRSDDATAVLFQWEA